MATIIITIRTDSGNARSAEHLAYKLLPPPDELKRRLVNCGGGRVDIRVESEREVVNVDDEGKSPEHRLAKRRKEREKARKAREKERWEKLQAWERERRKRRTATVNRNGTIRAKRVKAAA